MCSRPRLALARVRAGDTHRVWRGTQTKVPQELLGPRGRCSLSEHFPAWGPGKPHNEAARYGTNGSVSSIKSPQAREEIAGLGEEGPNPRPRAHSGAAERRPWKRKWGVAGSGSTSTCSSSRVRPSSPDVWGLCTGERLLGAPGGSLPAGRPGGRTSVQRRVMREDLAG